MKLAGEQHQHWDFDDLTVQHAVDMPHFPFEQDQAASKRAHESDEARTARLTIKTRRRRYLEKHAEYFASPSLELAGP